MPSLLSLLTELRDDLYRNATKWTASERILAEIRQVLLCNGLDDVSNSPTPVSTALGTLAHALGPDTRLRKWVVDLLDEQSLPISSLETLLRFLPSTFSSTVDLHYTKEVERKLFKCSERHPILIASILESVEAISGTKDTVNLFLEKLFSDNVSEFEQVLQYLSLKVDYSEIQEVELFIGKLRSRLSCASRPDDDIVVAAVSKMLSVVMDTLDTRKVDKLVGVYMDEFYCGSGAIIRDISPFDVAILFGLIAHSKYKDEVQELLDTCLSRNQFPFTETESILRVVGKAPISHLTMSLVEVMVFLVAAPLRVVGVAKEDVERIESVICKCFQVSDAESQIRLFRSLLEVAGQTSSQRLLQKTKKQRSSLSYTKVDSNSAADVHKLASSILCRLSEESPETLIPIRETLVSYLTFSMVPQDESMNIIYCRLLGRIERKNPDKSVHLALESLIRNLLLSTTGQEANDERAICGIHLATEFIESEHMDSDSKGSMIQPLVEQKMLPATRRVVNPRVGIAGIRFWSTLLEKRGQKEIENIFCSLKMVLSNTGLLQLMESYEKQRHKYTAQIYYMNGTSIENTLRPKQTIFCVVYYVRSSVRSPIEWITSVDWIFALVDQYLRVARKKSETSGRGWNAGVWQQAALEFPLFILQDDDSSDFARDWLQDLFSNWRSDCTSSEVSNIRKHLKVYLQDAGLRLTKLLDETFLFTGCVLHCVILLMAVVKNTSQPSCSSSDGLEGCIAMLYVLFAKLKKVQLLFGVFSGTNCSKKVSCKSIKRMFETLR